MFNPHIYYGRYVLFKTKQFIKDTNTLVNTTTKTKLGLKKMQSYDGIFKLSRL